MGPSMSQLSVLFLVDHVTIKVPVFLEGFENFGVSLWSLPFFKIHP